MRPAHHAMQDVEVMDDIEKDLFVQGTIRAFNEKDKKISFHDAEDDEPHPNTGSRSLKQQQSSLKTSNRGQRSLGKQASVFQRIDKVLEELSDDDSEDDDLDEAMERELLLMGLTMEETRARLASMKSSKKKFHPNDKLMSDKAKHEFRIEADGQATVTVQDNLAMRKAFLFYCKSAINAKDMHRAPVLPQMAPDMFVALCKDLKLVEPIGPLSMMTLGLTFATFESDDDDEGLSYSTFLDSLVELAFDAKRNVAALLQTLMEEELPQLQLKCNKEEERERMRSTMAGQSPGGGGGGGGGGREVPAAWRGVTPQAPYYAGGGGGGGGNSGDRPPTLIGGGKGSLTADYRGQTPLLGAMRGKGGSFEMDANPFNLSSDPPPPPPPPPPARTSAEGKAVPVTTAFSGVPIKVDSQPARMIVSTPQKNNMTLAEAAARQLEEEIQADRNLAAPTPIRLNPNLKSKPAAGPSSASNVAESSSLGYDGRFHRTSGPSGAAHEDDEDDDRDGWGSSRAEYSVADLSIERGLESVATIELKTQRPSPGGGGNRIMSSRNNPAAVNSPSHAAASPKATSNTPLFAKRSVSDDGVVKQQTLPSLNSGSKGLLKASTGSRTSNEANTSNISTLTKAASSRTSNSTHVSPTAQLQATLSKAPTATRTSNSSNASTLSKAGSSRLSNSGAPPPSMAKSSTATRGSNNGFVPMKIDWSKTPDPSLNTATRTSNTSTLTKAPSSRSPNSGATAAATLAKNAPATLAKAGSSRLS